MNRFIIIALTLLVLVLVSLALLWNLYRQVELSSAPKVPAQAVTKEVRPIYEIPANRIPTYEEIELSVKKDNEMKAVVKEAKAKAALEKAAVIPAVEPVKEEEKKEESSSGKIKDLLPEKKEVKFPTFEQRAAKESQSGVVAY